MLQTLGCEQAIGIDHFTIISMMGYAIAEKGESVIMEVHNDYLRDLLGADKFKIIKE